MELGFTNKFHGKRLCSLSSNFILLCGAQLFHITQSHFELCPRYSCVSTNAVHVNVNVQLETLSSFSQRVKYLFTPGNLKHSKNILIK